MNNLTPEKPRAWPALEHDSSLLSSEMDMKRRTAGGGGKGSAPDMVQAGISAHQYCAQHNAPEAKLPRPPRL